jgi:hypothetical protein
MKEQLIEPHYQRTVARIHRSDSKYILAIQDQMRLNYTTHLAKTEIGRIGKNGKTDQYGLIQHSVLCITDQNEPLGLMDVRWFHYDELDTMVHRHHRPIEDKAGRCWLEALDNMKKRLGNHSKRIITVADREGDFYEFLYPLVKAGEEFVIRAKHNRYTGEKQRDRDEKIWDKLKAAPVKGTIAVEIQDAKTREIKNLQLELKAITITLPPPKEKQAVKKDFEAINIHVIQAYNAEHEWVLLTNLPQETEAQIQEIVNIYRARWHIEDYQKVLKTGYQVDEIYLHQSRETIENLLTMACISACRLYWIIYVGRSEAQIKADELFEEFEWKAIYVYFKEKVPDESPRLSEVILRIARLGGYKPTKKGQPPGIKTIWIGYQQFTVAAQMYRNMSS